MIWQLHQLQDLCIQVTSGGTPPTSRPEYYGGDIPWLRTQEVNFNTIRDTELKITEDGLTNSAAKWIPENSVIVAMYGNSAGRVAVNQIPLTTNQACCNLIVDGAKADYRFIYYKLLLDYDVLHQMAKGAAQNNLNAGQIKTYSIRAPLVTQQERIADILSAYDDLIENNRRRMVLLEEAARQLYREWFVRLRFPGHEHTRITNGVPEGWERGYVDNFYNTASGGTPSRKTPDHFTGDIPWVKTQELSNGFIIDTQEKITEDALANSSAKLFPERTVLIALYGATVGELGILALPAATNQACCSVFPKDPRSHYIHAFLFFRENKAKLVSLSAGAAQKNISQQIVRGFEMVLPSKSLMEGYVDSLSTAFEQWLNLQRSNEKLRAARDLLLPRLVSGVISV